MAKTPLLRGLRIRIEQPPPENGFAVLVEAFDYFRRSGFVVRVGGEVGVLEVHRSRSFGTEADRQAVARHIEAWTARHPESPLVLDD